MRTVCRRESRCADPRAAAHRINSRFQQSTSRHATILVCARRGPSTWRWRCWRRGARAGATGSAAHALRRDQLRGLAMLALRSHVVEAAGARSGVEQPGQTIAGRSARRASCAARRQFGRGRAGERRAHRRLAGKVGLLRRLAGRPQSALHLHRRRRGRNGGLRLAAPDARDAVARQASRARHLRRLRAS